MSIEQEVGRRMRAIRLRQGASIEAVAARAGMTKGFLSKVERGERAPAIASLFNIASALGVKPADLLETDEGDARVSVVRANQRSPLIRYGNNFGYKYLPLACGIGQRQMEPFLCVVPPDPAVNGDGMTHPGEEFYFVLDGRMLATVGGVEYVLEPGDAIYYDSNIPHWGRSLTGAESTILMVISVVDQSTP
jgi:transcriptional regulator with XRE-family HTH domain